jgi:hypothetical protein
VKAKLITPTSTAVGGDVANSSKLAGPGAPVKVTFTVWRVEEPSESVVLATPLTSVVLCRGLTSPPPDVTDHVTTTPRTARPLASTTVTLKGDGNGLLKNQLCASPPLIKKSLGGPGGCMLSPPQAHAETPATRVITRFVVIGRKNGAGKRVRKHPLPAPSFVA